METIEVKAAITAIDAGQIVGYASLFGHPADLVGDIVAAGAFKSSIARNAPRMLSEHGGEPIGTWTEIAEDEIGLKVRGRFDLANPAGARAYGEVRAGRLAGLSIGYVATKSMRAADGVRTLEEVDLREISVVREPASTRAGILSTKSAPKDKTMSEAAPAADVAAIDVEVKGLAKSLADLKIPDLAPIVTRLDDLEKKSNRPGGAKPDGKEAEAAERKALATVLRTGSLEEVKTVGTIEVKNVASTDNDTAGGYFVLPTVDLTIRNLLTDLSPIRTLAEVVTIGTDRYERFYSMGRRGARWVSEREDRPEDTPRPFLIKHSYGVAELYAAPTATRHLLDDAATDISSWLINNATHDFAETEAEAFHFGDGVDGKPKGLQTYPTAPGKDFTREWGSFQYVPTGANPDAGKIGDALIRLIATLRIPYKGSAAFLMNSETAIMLRQIKDSNGRYLWAPTGNLIEGVDHPLLGQRVIIDEHMPNVEANKLPIAFGDFRQGYVVVDRQGVRINRDELTQKGRVIFDTYKRVGGGAGDFNAIKFLKIAAS